MIVLDTDVISELVRDEPDANVLGWLDGLDPTEIATTAVCAAELFHGVARLPDGRRRRRLEEALATALSDDLEARVEPFDAAAAGHYADIVSGRERAGRPIGVADGEIAAICRKLGATIATRNVDDFHGTGIEILDPWRSRPPVR